MISTRLHHAILKTANCFPNKIALQIVKQNGWQRLTYSELSKDIHITAQRLTQIGIKPGNRLILLGDNRPETLIAFLAILATDATAVLIDPTLPKIDLQKFIELADASAILVSPKYLNNLESGLLPVYDMDNGLAPCESHPQQVIVDKSASLDTDANIATILFTSGTTGHAKGVMLTHSNLLAAMEKAKSAISLTSRDSMLSFLPLYHVSPLIQNLVSLYSGATLTCIEKVDGASILATMQTVKPTTLGVVPLLLELFLEKIQQEISQQSRATQFIIRGLMRLAHHTRALTSYNLGFYLFNKIQRAFGGKLTRIICGGAPAKLETLTKLSTFGFTILEAYGLTETTGPICSNQLSKQVLGSVGLAFSDMQFRILQLDEKGIGEIIVQGPLVMKGYFRAAEATREVIKNGWFHTGDTGFINKKGFLCIRGRIKEVIVLPSGKKALPASIEEHYQDIEGIKEIAVFGMQEGAEIGEQIHAAIVLSNTKEPAHIENEIYLRASQLPMSSQIQRIHFLAELPKTAMLKVKRALLPSFIQSTSAAQTTECNEDTAIEEWLKQWLASKTLLSVNQIEKHKPFIYYGLDSLSILQLCEDIHHTFKIEISPIIIWEHLSIARLSLYLKNQVNLPVPSLSQSRLLEGDVEEIKKYAKYVLNPPFIMRHIKALIRFILSIFFRIFFRITVKGIENLPKDEAFIICANHASYLDGPALYMATAIHGINKKMIGLLADNYFKQTKLFHWIGNMIPFSRAIDAHAIQKNLTYIELCKQAARILLLFPEGTRSIDGKLQEFKSGIAWLAEQTGLKIIPAYIDGTHRLMPRGQHWVRPGKIAVTFGAPLIFQKNHSQIYQDFMQKIKLAIVDLIPRT